MYGREARLPIGTEILTKGNSSSQQLSLDEKVESMICLQEKIHQQAIGNIHNAQARQKRQYDAKHNQKTQVKVRFPSVVIMDISTVYICENSSRKVTCFLNNR
jgi:hypothetical protein